MKRRRWEPVKQCGGTTKAGKPCRREGTVTSYAETYWCPQHQDQKPQTTPRKRVQ